MRLSGVSGLQPTASGYIAATVSPVRWHLMPVHGPHPLMCRRLLAAKTLRLPLAQASAFIRAPFPQYYLYLAVTSGPCAAALAVEQSTDAAVMALVAVKL